MGGDPAEGEPVPTQGVAGTRGGHRGRCGGSILRHCSYSRTGRGGRRDGRGVGFRDGAPIITVARVRDFVPLLSAVHIQCFVFVLGMFLSSLIGGMEGKERECEEN